jgi:hypothetical protein
MEFSDELGTAALRRAQQFIEMTDVVVPENALFRSAGADPGYHPSVVFLIG